MKKKVLIAVIVTFIAIAGRAQDAAPVFINASAMKNIFISGNTNVVLLAAGVDESVFRFDPSATRLLEINASDNSLRLQAGTAGSARLKPTIYLTVGAIESLTIDGFVNLKTHSIINSDSMKIIVGADAKAQVITSGKVEVDGYEDAEVKYRVRSLSDNSIVKSSM